MNKTTGILIILFVSLTSVLAQEIELFSGALPAVVNTDQVNVRENGNLSSPVLYMVHEGEYIYLIGRTLQKEAIGNWDEYWYKVAHPRGDEFWIYGEFVTPLLESPSYNKYFSHISHEDISMKNGIYTLSAIHISNNYESLAPERVSFMGYEIRVFNNTMALFINGEIQDGGLPRIISSETNWLSIRSPVYESEDFIDADYLYMTGSEMTGGGSYFTIGFFQDKGLTINRMNNQFGTQSISTHTYTLNFNGQIAVSQGQMDYPRQYIILGVGNEPIYSSPEVGSAPQDITIPHWQGEDNFSNWEEVVNSGGNMWQLNTHELPSFTVSSRMDGNDQDEPRKRWYEITYQDIHGYILVEPDKMITPRAYVDRLDVDYFGP